MFLGEEGKKKAHSSTQSLKGLFFPGNSTSVHFTANVASKKAGNYSPVGEPVVAKNKIEGLLVRKRRIVIRWALSATVTIWMKVIRLSSFTKEKTKA